MEYIKDIAEKLIKKYGSRDPFFISEMLKLNIVYKDLGSLKGMYLILKNNRYAILNSTLDHIEKKCVCAHELGHDLLHRGFAKDVFLQDFMLYDMKNRPEYEADFFASSLLIDECELKELIKLNTSSADMAEAFSVSSELIEFKLKTI